MTPSFYTTERMLTGRDNFRLVGMACAAHQEWRGKERRVCEVYVQDGMCVRVSGDGRRIQGIPEQSLAWCVSEEQERGCPPKQRGWFPTACPGCQRPRKQCGTVREGSGARRERATMRITFGPIIIIRSKWRECQNGEDSVKRWRCTQWRARFTAFPLTWIITAIGRLITSRDEPSLEQALTQSPHCLARHRQLSRLIFRLMFSCRTLLI